MLVPFDVLRKRISGYVVGLIVSAVGDLQSGSLHPDPVHLTAHFLQPVDVAECGIRITVVRRGKNFTNIDADLVQNVRHLL